MNLEFSEEQQFIRDQARNFLTQECTPERVRTAMESAEAYDQALWQQIVELGWTAMAIPEAYGGLGLGALELCVIAEELGRVCAPVPFSSSVYLATQAVQAWGSEAQKQALLPKLASGELVGTFAHSEGLGAATVAATVKDGTINGRKIPVPDGDAANFAIVTALNEKGETGMYVVELEASGVSRQTVNSVDPSRSQASVNFENVAAESLGELANADAIATLLDSAAIVFSFEQLGGAHAALDMGMAYTRERYAFGRPVASFQAIKHKFADMFVAIELARSNAFYGASALVNNADDLPLAAATARVSATDAYYLCSKENIQAHGGMGFTWEFDCHLYYRRAQMLSSVLGTAAVWKDLVATRLLQAA